MHRSTTLSAVLLLIALVPARAQDARYREDLAFVEALRGRGDNDLALEFLQRLARNASPALLRELPLEFAKTRLRLAGDEAETARRLALYREAREDFQKFIAANPRHPRVAEANLEVARVLNLLGKTELNRALLAEDEQTKKEQALQARRTLVEASGQLQAAVKALETQRNALPDPEGIDDPKRKKEAQAARDRVDNDLNQTQLEMALNLYDQASTYFDPGSTIASQLLVRAQEILNPLASGAAGQPITWKARAWLGRIVAEIETVDKARTRFQQVLAATTPAAAEGIRLARYFRLLAIAKQPSEEERKKGVNNLLIEAAIRWRGDYPRLLRTPEGCGVTFLLATAYLEEATRNKRLARSVADDYRNRARNLLRELEQTENAFTERARRLKLETMAAQGLFKTPITNLRTFEDCYIRAQFEAIQLAGEPRDARDAEAKRKARIATILQALERGLALPEVKKMKASLELNNARAMLAYWSLQTGKLDEAIRVGETFARDDPRSSQAEMAAVYALQAYSQLVADKQTKFEEIAEDRARMFALAAYMEERWPRSLGGELARHNVGWQLLRDREPNFPEGIKKLSLIAPSYSNYAQVCRLLADACMRADREGIEPIPGDRPGDYRKRGLVVLERLPETALGSDPITNQMVIGGKAILGRELFKVKRFQTMDDLASRLLARLDKLRFHEDADRERGIRDQLRFELNDIRLYARYGLADAAFQAGDHARAASLLDPVVDATRADDAPQKSNLQKNQQLATALLAIALKANIQLGKIDRTDQVLDVMDRITTEGDAGSTNILKLLAFLIRGQVDELRKKGDRSELARAVEGYSKILNKRIDRQKKLTPEFLRVLADCYSSMEKHDQAAATLARIPDPRARPGTPEELAHRAVQVLHIRELRLSKTKEALQKARTLMDEIQGTSSKPGWGRRNLDALKENGLLLEAERKWPESFAVWSALTKNLSRQAGKGGPVKEHYLECYYHMILSFLEIAKAKPAREERDKAIRQAALQLVNFERAWEDFGSDASRRRFTELLLAEPALREQYESLKKKK